MMDILSWRGSYRMRSGLFNYFILALLILLAASPVYAGVVKGIVIDDTGVPVEGMTVYVYTGEDPERYTAMPEEKSRAIYSKTDASGNFSINVPDNIKTFNLRIKVDTTFYKDVSLNGIQNQPGVIQFRDAFIQQYGNNEQYWVSTDTNSSTPSTDSHFTNRWEQSKARGDGYYIYFPEPKIEPLRYEASGEAIPEIRGLPGRSR